MQLPKQNKISCPFHRKHKEAVFDQRLDKLSNSTRLQLQVDQELAHTINRTKHHIYKVQ